MNTKSVFWNCHYDHVSSIELKLLTEASIFIQKLYQNKILQLIHFLHTTSCYYQSDNIFISSNDNNVTFNWWEDPDDLEDDKINLLFSLIRPRRDDNWDESYDSYISTPNFDPQKNKFKVRLELSFIYIYHINFNGEFLQYDNNLRSAIEDQTYCADDDIHKFQLINNKYIPTYLNIIGHRIFDQHHIID